ncbi:winged helix-turn-helix domain-containing protein [Bordetella bronchiseptica]
MRILVIEDEPKLADYLHKGLSEQSHIVDVARDGINGRHLALEGDYELVILDVMLPDIDGFAVLAALGGGEGQKEGVVLKAGEVGSLDVMLPEIDGFAVRVALRAAARNTPVLMLTARDRVEDRVRGLEGGADDYLVKPFAFSELLARVHALQRRGRSQESTLLRLADLELDLASRKAQRAGRRLDLTAKEFSLLALLLRRQGQVLSRTTLAEQVWDMNFDSDTNVIDVAIRRLRGKLDDPYEAKLLHTVRGMGYVLESRPS